MQIFLYEFVTGGGYYSAGQAWPPPDSLLREGNAMLSALAADFCDVPHTRVTVLRDIRCQRLADRRVEQHLVDSSSSERRAFTALAAAADWTVVIAPEIGGTLAERCELVTTASGRLLGPSWETVEIASDKQCTAQWLAERDIPTPRGLRISSRKSLPADFSFPAVLKPIDGAGSLGVRLIESADQVPVHAGAWRLESFCPGVAASVALLCGPRGVFSLAPAAQLLSADGSFAYLGGALPLAESLAQRAKRLGRRAVTCLPRPLGYLGVDLVLGDDPRGCEDVVIEINPRLTTSYVGLRALANCNLAAAMLTIAEGRETTLCFDGRAIEFESSGSVRNVAQANSSS